MQRAKSIPSVPPLQFGLKSPETGLANPTGAIKPVSDIAGALQWKQDQKIIISLEHASCVPQPVGAGW